MSTIDKELIEELVTSDKTIIVAEQNNGYIIDNIRKILFAGHRSIDPSKIIGINTTSKDGLHYIHSGTYKELAAHYGLDAASIAATVHSILK